MAKDKYSISPDELVTIQKICVNCCGLIGDAFIRVPILEALRKKFPDSKLTVIVDPGSKIAVENHPAIDEIYTMKRTESKHKNLFIHLRKAFILRKERYDLFINLYSGGSSYLATFLINARIRLGFDHTKKLRFTNNLLVPVPSFTGNWTKALGAMLMPLGITSSDINRDTNYYCKIEDQQLVNPLFSNKEVKYVGVNLGAGSIKRRWPVSNFVALIEKIGEVYDIIPVVFFNPGKESYLADEFHKSYSGNTIKLKGYSFSQEAAALERCDVLLTADTALMHLAIGVKTPTFVFFLQTSPECVRPDKNLFFASMSEERKKLNKEELLEIYTDLPLEQAISDFMEFSQNSLHWAQKT